MEIRTKDKIFLAVFLPVAIIFAYVHFWRVDAARSLAALEATHERLVAVDDFPLSKRICEAKIAEAEKELEDEKNIAPTAPHVVADAAATIAVREREAMKVFRESGLVVLRSEAIDSRDGGIDAAAALRATGVCAEPVRRRYTLD